MSENLQGTGMFIASRSLENESTKLVPSFNRPSNHQALASVSNPSACVTTKHRTVGFMPNPSVKNINKKKTIVLDTSPDVIKARRFTRGHTHRPLVPRPCKLQRAKESPFNQTKTAIPNTKPAKTAVVPTAPPPNPAAAPPSKVTEPGPR